MVVAVVVVLVVELHEKHPLTSALQMFRTIRIWASIVVGLIVVVCEWRHAGHSGGRARAPRGAADPPRRACVAASAVPERRVSFDPQRGGRPTTLTPTPTTQTPTPTLTPHLQPHPYPQPHPK